MKKMTKTKERWRKLTISLSLWKSERREKKREEETDCMQVFCISF
jgi:hypothetical protein